MNQTKASFMGITAHWIKSKSTGCWTLHSKVIAFKGIAGAHNGENLGCYFVGLCKRAGIIGNTSSKVSFLSSFKSFSHHRVHECHHEDCPCWNHCSHLGVQSHSHTEPSPWQCSRCHCCSSDACHQDSSFWTVNCLLWVPSEGVWNQCHPQDPTP